MGSLADPPFYLLVMNDSSLQRTYVGDRPNFQSQVELNKHSNIAVPLLEINIISIDMKKFANVQYCSSPP